MDKEYFNNMTLSEQLAHVNTRLEGGESMRAISSSLGIHKNTIPSLLTKNGYVLDKVAKQYILTNSQDHRPIFNIPTKTKIKIETQPFNVVMKKSLVNSIDDLCKAKGGYSRNEMISIMCEYCLNNMK